MPCRNCPPSAVCLCLLTLPRSGDGCCCWRVQQIDPLPSAPMAVHQHRIGRSILALCGAMRRVGVQSGVAVRRCTLFESRIRETRRRTVPTRRHVRFTCTPCGRADLRLSCRLPSSVLCADSNLDQVPAYSGFLQIQFIGYFLQSHPFLSQSLHLLSKIADSVDHDYFFLCCLS